MTGVTGLDRVISRGTFQPQSFCEIPVSFHAEIHAACWLQRYSFTQVQGYFVKCFLRADILLYTLFTALHSERTNCFSSVLLTEKENPSFDSACAISQCRVNGTNCPAFLSFSPSCQSSRSLKSFSLTKVVLQTLSVMQQTLSELSFHFPNMFSNSCFLLERKDCHFHCWQHSLKKKGSRKHLVLSLCFLLLATLATLLFHLVVLTQFYVFLSLTALLVPGRYCYKEKMRRMLIKM